MTIWFPEISGRKGSLSRAIVDALSEDIEAGRLEPGAQLPTHRELAERLGVAIGTVTRAYALAQRQGLISGEVGRGTFVGQGVGIERITHEPDEETSPIDLSKNRVLRDVRDPMVVEGLAALGTRPDLAPLFDYYQTAAGTGRHRAAIASWISRPGFAVSPEQTLICSGAQHALVVILATLTKPGDTVLTEQVTYPGLKALANLFHLHLQGLPMDEHGLQPEAFKEACRAGTAKVLYCIPTLHNPTAAVMPDARRQEIAAIAEANNIAIIEDDVYGFLYEEAPPPVAAYAPEHCYYINSASKSIAPGLRIGYVVSPPEALHRVATAICTTAWEAPPVMAELMTIWIENGTADRVVNWKRREIAARYTLATSILGSPQGDPPPASCHIWMPLPEPWRSEDFVAQARARGVSVPPSETFVVGRGTAPHAVRICLGSPQDRGQLEKGLHILAEILQGSPEPALSIV